MMLFEFQMLPDARKIALLYEEGVYIGKRRVNNNIALLYQLEGYYVEVIYKSYRKHIKRINCFQTTAPLDPYIENMAVKHLVY